MAPGVTATPEARCSLELSAAREATEAQLLALIAPSWKPGVGLPAVRDRPSSDASETYLVETCLGPKIATLEPPRVGAVERLRLEQGRELVQFPVGTQAGMVGYTVGVVALLVHEPARLRLLAIEEKFGPLDGGLTPYRRADFGGTAVLLQTTSTGPEHEDYGGGTTVWVYRAGTAGLKLLGSMVEREATHEVFWRGPFDYVMTSSGPLPEAAGFVVHEEWTFVHRVTHARTKRALERHYILKGEQVVASPPNDREAWPETSTQGWPSPFEPSPT